MKGLSINPLIGVGDGIQFTSVPENYFRATGEKLYDVSKPWFFDSNPYIIRDPRLRPKVVTEMWNFGPQKYEWPIIRPKKIYLSNAEIHASVWGVPVVLNRPRLYRYEEFPYENRQMILLHIDGRSHGLMPLHVINHVLEKYGPTQALYQVGKSFIDLGIPKIYTKTLWDLAEVVSKARMFIGMDSGPSWVAACYPDVVIKKLRTKPVPEVFKDWIPLEMENIHSHWDDRLHQTFNPTKDDIGFTSSYLKM